MFEFWAAGKGVSDPFSTRGIANSEGMLDIITPSADRMKHTILTLLSVDALVDQEGVDHIRE